MGTASHGIEIRNGVAWVTLEGQLEKEDAAAYLVELASFLEQNRIAKWCIDLRPLKGCSIFARGELVKAQRELAVGEARTAYLATTSRFRGLALWIAHLSEDPRAKSVITEEQVDDWLNSDRHREDSARADLDGGGR